MDIIVVELHSPFLNITAPASADVGGESIAQRVSAVKRCSHVGTVLTRTGAYWNTCTRIRGVARQIGATFGVAGRLCRSQRMSSYEVRQNC